MAAILASGKALSIRSALGFHENAAAREAIDSLATMGQLPRNSHATLTNRLFVPICSTLQVIPADTTSHRRRLLTRHMYAANLVPNPGVADCLSLCYRRAPGADDFTQLQPLSVCRRFRSTCK